MPEIGDVISTASWILCCLLWFVIGTMHGRKREK